MRAPPPPWFGTEEARVSPQTQGPRWGEDGAHAPPRPGPSSQRLGHGNAQYAAMRQGLGIQIKLARLIKTSLFHVPLGGGPVVRATWHLETPDADHGASRIHKGASRRLSAVGALSLPLAIVDLKTRQAPPSCCGWRQLLADAGSWLSWFIQLSWLLLAAPSCALEMRTTTWVLTRCVL